MSIKADDLKRIVKNFLKVMEEEEVPSLLVSEQPKKRFPIPKDPNECVSIEFRPSSSNIKAYVKSPTISYEIPDRGVPLEVRINPYEGYSRIILKTVAGTLPGYTSFAIDRLGNIAQSKRLSSTDVSEVKKELEGLLKLI